MLFSATLPKAIQGLSENFMKKDRIHVKVGKAGGASHSIIQHILFVKDKQKQSSLLDLLKSDVDESKTLGTSSFVVCSDLCSIR